MFLHTYYSNDKHEMLRSCPLSLYLHKVKVTLFQRLPFIFFVTDLSVMARQVNAVLCSAVGSHSTTHCCLHDQSVHTTGKVFIYSFIYNFFLCSGKLENVDSSLAL